VPGSAAGQVTRPARRPAAAVRTGLGRSRARATRSAQPGAGAVPDRRGHPSATSPPRIGAGSGARCARSTRTQRDVVLLRPPLRHELRVVRDRYACHEHGAMTLTRLQQAASADPDRVGRRGLGGNSSRCGGSGIRRPSAARPPKKKADRFGSATRGRAAPMSLSRAPRPWQEVWNQGNVGSVDARDSTVHGTVAGRRAAFRCTT
jgi:hypothetical protein